jgi:hypothetical protein
MASLAANGCPVLVCRISMPLTGAWVADLELDAETAPTGALTIEQGALRFVGTVIRSGVIGGRAHVRMVGGAGGLRKTVPAQSYQKVPLRIPLRSALADVGETLSLSVSSGLLDKQLDHWTRAEGPAGTAVARILDEVGASWRVLADGTVWAGEETWPTQRVAAEPLDPDPVLGTFTIAPDVFDLRPGVTFLGRKVSRVEHSAENGKLRTVYWVEQEGETPGLLDPVKAKLAAFVRWVMRDVTYHKLYSATVVGQNADGTLDLTLDDKSIAGKGLQGIKIRHGLPGCKVSVKKDATILLGFENGDPNLPYASLWTLDDKTLESISVDGGTQPVNRVGDLVISGGPQTMVTITVLTPVAVATPVGPGMIATGTAISGFVSFAPGAPDLSGASAQPLYGATATGAQKLLG